MADRIRARRDTSANWASINPVLADGELGYDKTSKVVKVGDGVTAWNSLAPIASTGDAGVITWDDLAAPPATPAAGAMAQWSQPVAGRLMPHFMGPTGQATTLQPLFARNKVGIWSPAGNGTGVPGVDGYTALTIVGTATARNVATTNMFTRTRRLGIVSAATAAALASFRQPVAQITTGAGSGLGGFFKVIRFGISDAAAVAGARMFVGVSSSTAAPTNVEPSTLTQCVGVGHRAADTNLHVFYGGSAAQAPINLGANFPSNTLNTDLYELALFAPTSASDVRYQVTRLNTGHTASGTLANSGGVALPAPTTLLSPTWGFRTNNATALAVGIDLVSDYFETDV